MGELIVQFVSSAYCTLMHTHVTYSLLHITCATAYFTKTGTANFNVTGLMSGICFLQSYEPIYIIFSSPGTILCLWLRLFQSLCRCVFAGASLFILQAHLRGMLGLCCDSFYNLEVCSLAWVGTMKYPISL